MRTRSSSNLIVESFTIPKQRNRRHSKQIFEPELRTIVETPVATMTDTRTMSKLLQAPTEGYRDAIVIPAILAEDFKLKVGLLQLVTSSQFHGFERDDPHVYIRWFNKITSMLKYKNVPYDTIKLMLFPFSLEGATRNWLVKEPPRSIHTWEDLVSKFVNYFFLPSKTTNLKNDITNFQQKFDETFSEAWDPASGNLLNRTRREALTIIENKSKVRTSQNKLVASKVNTTTSTSPSPDVTTLTKIVKELLLNIKATQQATVKAIKDNCVICGGSHPYYECLASGGNTFDACAAVGTYNQGGDLKAITTRSDVAYEGPLIPPISSSLPKEVEREPEVIKDKVQSTSSESTTHVQSLVVQVPIPKPKVVLKPNPKPSITYPLRLNDQKLREKTNSQMLKFLQIFQRLHFDLSFVDALLHIPKFAFTFKSLLTGIAEDVFVQGDRTVRALVDVHEKELILRDGDEKLIFHADNTPKHPHKHGNELINMINFIDITCEDRFPEVLKFKKTNHPSSGSTTPISDFCPSLTPFETSDSLLEEFADELALLEPFPLGNEDNNFDFEADLRKIKYLLNQNPSTESDVEIIDPILEKSDEDFSLLLFLPQGQRNSG
uniref:Reverse transcriptase domain-containing protein n=1 Tax=Tanacetum cinerariifolium TaxID=118510 RepID=A0A6L2MMF3_TANCI|nr:reverse transcriptase domain-containing protein [Tanacetum cinerariifolium]